MIDTFDALFDEAVTMFGGNESRLAAAAGVSQNAIWQMKRAKRASPQMAIKLEHATKGTVPRWKLRPDLWDAPNGAVEPKRSVA